MRFIRACMDTRGTADLPSPGPAWQHLGTTDSVSEGVTCPAVLQAPLPSFPEAELAGLPKAPTVLRAASRYLPQTAASG